jgi:hypothetical protein
MQRSLLTPRESTRFGLNTPQFQMQITANSAREIGFTSSDSIALTRGMVMSTSRCEVQHRKKASQSFVVSSVRHAQDDTGHLLEAPLLKRKGID